MRIDSPSLVGTTTLTGSVVVTGSITPGTNASFDFGTASKKWNNVYATAFSGSLTKLSDGTSFLVAGSGISITSGSNGSVVITNDGTVGDITAVTAGTGLTGGGTSGAVTLNVNDSVVATVSGSTFTGAVKFNSGLSGSLTRLTDGTSYLVAGSNVTITTGSSGAVTIASTSAAGTLSGAGTTNYIPKYTASTTLGNSVIYDDGTNIGIGTITPAALLTVSGTIVTKYNTGLESYIAAGTYSAGTTGLYPVYNTQSVTGGTFGSNDTVVKYGAGGNSYVLLHGTTVVMSANSSENVSIGTNSYAGRLFVSGSSTASTPTAVIREGVVSPTGGAGTFDVQNSSGTSLLFVSGSGNVGVGTSTVNGRFEVHPGGSQTAGDLLVDSVGKFVYIGRQSPTGGDNTSFIVRDRVGTQYIYANTSAPSYYLSLGTYLNQDTVRINGGNVGIGTTLFTDKLAVNGSMSVTGSALPGTDNLYNLGSPTKRWANVYATSVSGSLTGSNVIAGQVVVAGTGGVLSGSNNFWWDNSNTRVGIGTASPIGKLSVGSGNQSVVIDSTGTGGVGTIQSYNGALKINDLGNNTILNTGGGTVGIGTTNPPASKLFVSGSGTLADTVAIFKAGVVSPTDGAGVLDVQNSAGTSLLFVSGSGRVGINSSTPSYNLEVAGNARVSSTFVQLAGDVYLNQSATGNSYFYTRAFFAKQGGVGGGGSNYERLSVTYGNITNEAAGTGTYPNFEINNGGNVRFNIPSSLTSALGITGSLEPDADNTRDLGSASKRWRNLYATSLSGSLTGSNVSVGQVVVAGTGGVLSGSNNFWWDNSSQSVGIGTSTVRESLQVVGNIKVGTTTSDSFIAFGDEGNSGRNNGIYRPASTNTMTLGAYSYMTFNVSANSLGSQTERMRIDSSGNAGIGTNTYTARLFVSGSSTASTPTMVVREGVVSPTGGAGTLDVQNSAGTSLLFVSGSGNVGIGTTNPVSTGTGLTIYQATNGQLWLQNSSGYSRLVVSSTDLYVDNNVAGSAGSIIFRRGSGTTESARIDASGNVGIGTTQPFGTNARLNIQLAGTTASGYTSPTNAGLLLDCGTSTNGAISIIGGATLGYYFSNSSNPYDGGIEYTNSTRSLSLRTAASNRVTVDSSGNVGIGTTTYTARLFVSGSGTASTPTMIVREGVVSATGGAGTFDVQNSAGTSLLFVSGSGAVGIGTTVSQLPTHKLHVSGKIGGGLYADSSLEFLATGNTELKANTDLKLGYLLTTVIRNTGNVGVGTLTPSSRLHVYGSSTANTPTMIVQEGVASPTDGVPAFDVRNVSGTTLLFVTGSGYVGIGTTSPKEKLHVYGDLKVGVFANGSFVSLGDEGTTGKYIGIYRAAGDTFLKLGGYGGMTFNVSAASLGSQTERMRIDSSGNVGIGTATYTARLFVSGSSTASTPTMVIREGVVSPTGGADILDVQNSAGTSLLTVSGSGFVGIGTSDNLIGTKVAIYGATAPDTFTGHILLSSNTASSAVDNGGQLNFQIYDGSSYRGSGFVKSAKENGTASNYSSYMSFGTRNNGDSVLTERLRIDSTGSIGIGTTVAGGRLYVTGSSSTSQPSFVVRAGTAVHTGGTKIVDILNSSGTGLFHVSGSGDVTVGLGNLVIGTSGKGIDFSATANAPSGTLGQEILDDYEEGTWTPGTAQGGGSITFSASGYYTKIGRVVHAMFTLDTAAVSGVRTTLQITGLPFQVDVSYSNAWVEAYNLSNTGGLLDDFSHAMVWTNATSNRLTVDIYETTSGLPISNPASFFQAGTLLAGYITYITNQ